MPCVSRGTEGLYVLFPSAQACMIARGGDEWSTTDETLVGER
jgi:hypothetical protein